MTWKQYGIGLLNAGISGATTTAIGAGLGLTAKQISLMALGSFLVSAGKWYLQHPPPGVPKE